MGYFIMFIFALVWIVCMINAGFMGFMLGWLPAYAISRVIGLFLT